MDTPQTPPMSSYRPYLLRALVEWINDNYLTPHVLVDATIAGVQVPASAVHEGRVILNIAERAVAHLHMDNQTLSFSARFGGVSFPVSVPIAAILAVYARENGQGMALPPEESMPAPVSANSNQPSIYSVTKPKEQDPPPDPPLMPTPPPNGPGKRSHLRVVK